MIGQSRCLETKLSDIEFKARDRLELLDFKKKSFENNLKFEYLNGSQRNLISMGYVFVCSTKITSGKFSVNTYQNLSISKKGNDLLNSPTYKFLSIFARYF